MKKLSVLLAGAMLMMATSAWAIPTLDAGYSWINAPFWTNTDKTTLPANGNSQFALTFENAYYESDFGLFSVTGTTLNPVAIETKFQIFKYNQNPTTTGSGMPGTKATVFFKNDGSVSLDGTTFTAFEREFGFYFDVHTNPTSDTVDSSFYSYNPFNTPTSEAGKNHVLTAFNKTTHEVLIYLDDQLIATGSDRDFDDMVVYGNDLAPVPEPGTMVLLGFGMLGLAIYGKRRMNKES